MEQMLVACLTSLKVEHSHLILRCSSRKLAIFLAQMQELIGNIGLDVSVHGEQCPQLSNDKVQIVSSIAYNNNKIFNQTIYTGIFQSTVMQFAVNHHYQKSKISHSNIGHKFMIHVQPYIQQSKRTNSKQYQPIFQTHIQNSKVFPFYRQKRNENIKSIKLETQFPKRDELDHSKRTNDYHGRRCYCCNQDGQYYFHERSFSKSPVSSRQKTFQLPIYDSNKISLSFKTKQYSQSKRKLQVQVKSKFKTEDDSENKVNSIVNIGKSTVRTQVKCSKWVKTKRNHQHIENPYSLRHNPKIRNNASKVIFQSSGQQMNLSKEGSVHALKKRGIKMASQQKRKNNLLVNTIYERTTNPNLKIKLQSRAQSFKKREPDNQQIENKDENQFNQTYQDHQYRGAQSSLKQCLNLNQNVLNIATQQARKCENQQTEQMLEQFNLIKKNSHEHKQFRETPIKSFKQDENKIQQNSIKRVSVVKKVNLIQRQAKTSLVKHEKIKGNQMLKKRKIQQHQTNLLISLPKQGAEQRQQLNLRSSKIIENLNFNSPLYEQNILNNKQNDLIVASIIQDKPAQIHKENNGFVSNQDNFSQTQEQNHKNYKDNVFSQLDIFQQNLFRDQPSPIIQNDQVVTIKQIAYQQSDHSREKIDGLKQVLEGFQQIQNRTSRTIPFRNQEIQIVPQIETDQLQGNFKTSNHVSDLTDPTIQCRNDKDISIKSEEATKTLDIKSSHSQQAIQNPKINQIIFNPLDKDPINQSQQDILHLNSNELDIIDNRLPFTNFQSEQEDSQENKKIILQRGVKSFDSYSFIQSNQKSSSSGPIHTSQNTFSQYSSATKIQIKQTEAGQFFKQFPIDQQKKDIKKSINSQKYRQKSLIYKLPSTSQDTMSHSQLEINKKNLQQFEEYIFGEEEKESKERQENEKRDKAAELMKANRKKIKQMLKLETIDEVNESIYRRNEIKENQNQSNKEQISQGSAVREHLSQGSTVKDPSSLSMIKTRVIKQVRKSQTLRKSQLKGINCSLIKQTDSIKIIQSHYQNLDQINESPQEQQPQESQQYQRSEMKQNLSENEPILSSHNVQSQHMSSIIPNKPCLNQSLNQQNSKQSIQGCELIQKQQMVNLKGNSILPSMTNLQEQDREKYHKQPNIYPKSDLTVRQNNDQLMLVIQPNFQSQIPLSINHNISEKKLEKTEINTLIGHDSKKYLDSNQVNLRHQNGASDIKFKAQSEKQQQSNKQISAHLTSIKCLLIEQQNKIILTNPAYIQKVQPNNIDQKQRNAVLNEHQQLTFIKTDPIIENEIPIQLPSEEKFCNHINQNGFVQNVQCINGPSQSRHSLMESQNFPIKQASQMQQQMIQNRENEYVNQSEMLTKQVQRLLCHNNLQLVKQIQNSLLIIEDRQSGMLLNSNVNQSLANPKQSLTSKIFELEQSNIVLQSQPIHKHELDSLQLFQHRVKQLSQLKLNQPNHSQNKISIQVQTDYLLQNQQPICYSQPHCQSILEDQSQYTGQIITRKQRIILCSPQFSKIQGQEKRSQFIRLKKPIDKQTLQMCDNYLMTNMKQTQQKQCSDNNQKNTGIKVVKASPLTFQQQNNCQQNYDTKIQQTPKIYHRKASIIKHIQLLKLIENIQPGDENVQSEQKIKVLSQKSKPLQQFPTFPEIISQIIHKNEHQISEEIVELKDNKTNHRQQLIILNALSFIDHKLPNFLSTIINKQSTQICLFINNQWVLLKSKTPFNIKQLLMSRIVNQTVFQCVEMLTGMPVRILKDTKSQNNKKIIKSIRSMLSKRNQFPEFQQLLYGVNKQAQQLLFLQKIRTFMDKTNTSKLIIQCNKYNRLSKQQQICNIEESTHQAFIQLSIFQNPKYLRLQVDPLSANTYELQLGQLILYLSGNYKFILYEQTASNEYKLIKETFLWLRHPIQVYLKKFLLILEPIPFKQGENVVTARLATRLKEGGSTNRVVKFQSGGQAKDYRGGYQNQSNVYLPVQKQIIKQK